MKAIFINGSPRKNKNTAQMLESAMEGAQEALLEPLHYDIILGESNRVLGIFGGQPEMLCSHETYQFNDYSKYETAVDEPTRAHIRETRFPQDLQKAFDLGKRLVEKAKEQ